MSVISFLIIALKRSPKHVCFSTWFCDAQGGRIAFCDVVLHVVGRFNKTSLFSMHFWNLESLPPYRCEIRGGLAWKVTAAGTSQANGSGYCSIVQVFLFLLGWNRKKTTFSIVWWSLMCVYFCWFEMGKYTYIHIYFIYTLCMHTTTK